MTPIVASFFNMGPGELAILALIGVLLFGRRLPEVGRYLGKGIVEFKKGMKGLEDDIEGTSSAHPPTSAPVAIEPPRPPQRVGVTAPKFQDNTTSVPANQQTPQV